MLPSVPEMYGIYATGWGGVGGGGHSSLRIKDSGGVYVLCCCVCVTSFER